MPRLLALAALVWIGAVRPVAAAPCELRGSPARAQVRVRVAGHAGFTLELTAAPLVARFARTTTLELLGPLHFSGAAVHLPLALARPVVADAGRVRLSTAVQVLRARGSGDRLRLAVAIAPRTSIGARVSPVLVACADVRLGDRERPTPRVSPDVAASWLARPRLLALHDRPEGTPRTRVLAEERLALPLAEVERRRGWVHVRAAWTDGSAIAGWVPRAQLSPAPRGSLGFFTHGELGTSSCKRAPRPVGAHGYAGPATLRAGAEIHAAPARGRWADTREDVAVEVEIADVANDEWIRVTVVPGVAELCGRLDNAWVHRDHLDLTRPRQPPAVDAPTPASPASLDVPQQSSPPPAVDAPTPASPARLDGPKRPSPTPATGSPPPASPANLTRPQRPSATPAADSPG